MKKIIISVLALLASFASAQSTPKTPNLNFWLPPYGMLNWQVPYNANTSQLDLLLSGQAPLPGIAISGKPTFATSSAGQLGYDTTAKNWHVNANGVDNLLVVAPAAPGNGNCPVWAVSSGHVTLGDSGSPCAAALGFTPLRPSNNLSDVSNASAARGNLGLGTAATQPTSSFDTAGAATAAQSAAIAASDPAGSAASAQASSAQKSANLSDLASLSAARGNLGAASTGANTYTGTQLAPRIGAAFSAAQYGSIASAITPATGNGYAVDDNASTGFTNGSNVPVEFPTSMRLFNAGFVTPEEFGAVGNAGSGSPADDTAPVQACFNYSSAHGATCETTGKYQINGTVWMPTSLHWQGSAQGNSAFVCGSTTPSSCFRMMPGVVQFLKIENVRIAGVGASNTCQVGLDFTSVGLNNGQGYVQGGLQQSDLNDIQASNFTCEAANFVGGQTIGSTTISTISMGTPGSGYLIADTITGNLTDGTNTDTCTPYVYVAPPATSGGIIECIPAHPAQTYVSTPTLTFSGGSGTGAAGTPVLGYPSQWPNQFVRINRLDVFGPTSGQTAAAVYMSGQTDQFKFEGGQVNGQAITNTGVPDIYLGPGVSAVHLDNVTVQTADIGVECVSCGNILIDGGWFEQTHGAINVNTPANFPVIKVESNHFANACSNSGSGYCFNTSNGSVEFANNDIAGAFDNVGVCSGTGAGYFEHNYTNGTAFEGTGCTHQQVTASTFFVKNRTTLVNGDSCATPLQYISSPYGTGEMIVLYAYGGSFCLVNTGNINLGGFGSSLTVPGGSFVTFVRFDAATTWALLSAPSSVSSIANSDGSLTISPATGSAVASVNPAHSNAWTAPQYNSTSGAASTPAQTWTGAPYSAGSGTTNFPLLYYNCSGSTARTTFSTGGTIFGLNACTFGGNYMDFGAGGVSAFAVSSSGRVTDTGGINISRTAGDSTAVIAAVGSGTGATISTSNSSTGDQADFGSNAKILNGGGAVLPSVLPSTLYSVAGTPLPTCAAGIKGQLAVVSDATSPTYMGGYTGSGTITASVICSYNSTTYSWLTH